MCFKIINIDVETFLKQLEFQKRVNAIMAN